MVLFFKQVASHGAAKLIPALPLLLMLTFHYYRRILLFPHGNNIDQCSIYLEHGFDADSVPDNWSCCVLCALVARHRSDWTLVANGRAFRG